METDTTSNGVTNEEMLRFFSVLSHDLKSPIFAIDGFSELLLGDYIDKLDEEGQDFLRRIRTSAQYMKRVLDDMSHMVKLLARPTAKKTTPLRELIEEAMQKHSYAIEDGGVTNNLLATIRESGAEMAMRDAAADGVAIAAIGAAATCFGTHARDMQHGGSALPALGWLDATVIDTGFDASDDTMLRRLMSIEGTRLGLGIPPKTALSIGADGVATIIGEGNIAAFRKG